MAAGAPDVNQLLELLTRAADELKASQHETAVARADAETFAKRLVRVEADLGHEKERARRLQTQIDDFGVLTLPPTPREQLFGPVPVLPDARPTGTGSDHSIIKTVPIGRAVTLMDQTVIRLEENTNVSRGDPEMVGKRFNALEGELQAGEDERRVLREKLQSTEAQHEQLKARARELEGLLTDAKVELERAASTTTQRDDLQKRLAEAENALAFSREQLVIEQARGADIVTRLHAWEVRAKDLEHALALQETASVADNDAVVTENSQLEAELVSLKARSSALEVQVTSLDDEASEARRALADANLRMAHLEQDLGSVRGRRDELNVEIARVENDRKTLLARVAELEAALASLKGDEEKVREQLVAGYKKTIEELEVAVGRERDKMQITAQKLVEARGQTRELEGQLEKASSTLARRDAELAGLNDANATEYNRLKQDHDAVVGNLQKRIGELDTQIERANSEWRHVEQQYEHLHREMLTLLDQRDEARRELARLKPPDGW